MQQRRVRRGSRLTSRRGKRAHVRSNSSDLLLVKHAGKRRHRGRMLLRVRHTAPDSVDYELQTTVAVNPGLVAKIRSQLRAAAVLTMAGEADSAGGSAVKDLTAQRHEPCRVRSDHAAGCGRELWEVGG